MRSLTQNAALDALAVAAFALLFTTWLLVEFVLYPGSIFWGIGFEVWSELHFWSFLVVIAVAVVHFALHGRWSTWMSPSRRPVRRRFWLALVGLVAMLALVIVSFFATVQQKSSAPQGRKASYTETYTA